jgi:type 2 lantibiotic biosynthesis protein LanM
VGERLEELAIPGDGEQVAWVGIGLRGATEWTIEPVAGDLYGGISGIAFFLAYLGEVEGEERFTELARRGFATVEGWLDEGRPVFDTPGGFGGWGSFFYAAAHLGALWGDDALLERTAGRLADFEPTIDTTPETDVVGGLAGCAAALLAFHRTTGSAAALAAAERCGERLVALAEPAEGGVGWPSEEREWPAMAGFSHGNAGTAWALLTVAAASDRPESWKRKLRETALAALAHERTLFSERWKNWADLRGFAREEWAKYSTVAWCHGAVGVALGRLGGLPWLDDAEVRREIEAALDTTVERGFGRSHCLCHGDLSAIEALAEAGRRLGDEGHRREAERRAAALLESIEQDGWFCGVPTGIETPGLLIGLAGIGYGLLRLADPDRIPSLLLLEPPATVGG